MKLTYWSHSAFTVEIKDAKILIDPFFTGNPTFPEDATVASVSEGVTHVLLTHGHDDHVGDALHILKETGAQLTSNFEICMWAQSRGIENINPMGSGGCVDVGPFKVALTQAQHSSSTAQAGDGQTYMGNPNGIVVIAEGEPTLLHMGDTDIFSDMALIHEIYQPEVGIVPIGDRFTMGAETAAMACKRYFNFKTIVPCHYKTFPILDQSADHFIETMGTNGFRIADLKPGETVEIGKE
ncbi:metal-dependent hydrolase [Pseudovibrio sp. SPO723]|uniref:metal-dependent hydrolase n=1 Tax=Nesiotobacter zosterae TaxID=392721 RepID=UPI0029C2FEBE|nr:metal-dependent hydrolase [Pseudovibrio sp. SPO723]MDX5594454.1 metal-dependent hydrolase [Pseudovibrio sp. SPO723]